MPNRKLSRGILNSEGFAFCSISDHYGVDLIIESGVCNGGSTTILCKYFNDIPIVSIDSELKTEAVVRTSIFHNVTLINGDSHEMIPQILDAFKDSTIAVLIDGPKSINAITLGKKCFDHSHVKVIGIHDLFKSLYGKIKQDRVMFDKLDIPNRFITDNPEFVSTFKYLDGDDTGGYHPKYFTKEIGGYGPTIGFMLK